MASPAQIPNVIYPELPAGEHCELPIQGMTRASCARRIERALRSVPGVTDAQVNVATSWASVDYDPANVTPEALVRTVEEAGYEVLRPVSLS
jgi:Cu+-exporting ATPase